MINDEDISSKHGIELYSKQKVKESLALNKMNHENPQVGGILYHIQFPLIFPFLEQNESGNRLLARQFLPGKGI